jgi:hypothetical protein
MAAYLKGVRKFNEGESESTLALLEQKLKLDRALLDQMCWPAIPADGAINAESIAAFGEWAAARDLINKPVPAAMFWEPRFIDSRTVCWDPSSERMTVHVAGYCC